jgi:hypothetical protein
MPDQKSLPEVDTFRIRIEGTLDEKWTSTFEDTRLDTTVNGETTLTGIFRDQAALHGILGKIRDLGIPLLEVSINQERSGDDLDMDKPP